MSFTRKYPFGPSETEHTLKCPSCKAPITIKESKMHAGHKVKCKTCGEEHTLKGEDMRGLIAGHEQAVADIFKKK